MYVLVAIKALTVVYAIASAARARFHVAIAAALVILVLSVVLPLLILTDHAGELGARAIEHPYVAPLLSAIVGAITTVASGCARRPRPIRRTAPTRSSWAANSSRRCDQRAQIEVICSR